MAVTEEAFSGACNCGAVTFVAELMAQDVFICHCSVCRRYTGANGIAVVIVPQDRFRWEHRDKVTTWKKPGADWQSNFCSICGSAVPGKNDEHTMYVPAGLLEAADLAVSDHLYVGSKARWDQICDGGRQHDGAYQP